MAGAVEKSHSLFRLESFSDAVTAVAMTVLVLELKVPEIPEAARRNRLNFGFLLHHIPKFVAFILSFFIIAVTWITLLANFRRATRASLRLTWLTLLLLFFVCLLPWVTAFWSEYPFLPQAVFMYGLIGTGVISGGSLLQHHLSKLYCPEEGPFHNRVNLLIASLALIGSLAAFISVYAAFACYAICAARFMIPQRVLEALLKPKDTADSGKD